MHNISVELLSFFLFQIDEYDKYRGKMGISSQEKKLNFGNWISHFISEHKGKLRVLLSALGCTVKVISAKWVAEERNRQTTVLTLVLSAMVRCRRTRSSRFSTTSVWKVCQFLVTTNCRPDSRSSTDSTHTQARFVSRCGSDTYKINIALKNIFLRLCNGSFNGLRLWTS